MSLQAAPLLRRDSGFYALGLLLCTLSLVLGLATLVSLTLASTPKSGAQRLTITAPDVASRDSILRLLRQQGNKLTITSTDSRAVASWLEPWLGSTVNDASLPVPYVISLGSTERLNVESLRRRIKPISAEAQVITYAEATAPLAAAQQSLAWLARGMAALVFIAMISAVALVVGRLVDHNSTALEVVHLLGATPQQVIRTVLWRLTPYYIIGLGSGMGMAALAWVWLATTTQQAPGIIPGLTLGDSEIIGLLGVLGLTLTACLITTRLGVQKVLRNVA